MKCKALTKTPMAVHQWQADRSVGVKHLLRGDHLDLDGIDIQAEFVQGDPFDCVVNLAQRREIPVWTDEERGRGLEAYRLGQTCVRHGLPPLQTVRGTLRRFETGHPPGASRSAGAQARPRCRLAIDR